MDFGPLIKVRNPNMGTFNSKNNFDCWVGLGIVSSN